MKGIHNLKPEKVVKAFKELDGLKGDKGEAMLS